MPEVKALAENAQVTVIQANEANGMRASIYVQPNDGGALQTYDYPNSYKKLLRLNV